MEKLLNKYAADRSEKNAMALVKYDNKHPFAAMFLTQDQADMLAQAKRVVEFNSRREMSYEDFCRMDGEA